MNRVTRQRLKPFIIIWCFLFITVTNCDIKALEDDSSHGVTVAVSNSAATEKVSNLQPAKIDPKKPPVINSNVSTSANENITSNRSNHDTISTTQKIPSIFSDPLDNSGAFQRGVLVFLGLSVIVIAYIIFRCMRLNKSRTQMVRKYGVLAHRQDVEMRPLPLDEEDEDDTTVFDASEVGVHDKPRRNM